MKPLLSLFLLALPLISVAQQNADSVSTLRPVWASYSLTAGSSHITDTYLSPIPYSGWNTGFRYTRLQAPGFAPRQWVMQLDLSLSASGTKNQARNARLWQGEISASWVMLRRWQLPYGLSVGVGPQIRLDAGCLYLRRNGNNPASAKAAITLAATAYAAWSGNIGRMPITLRYQPSLPTIGAFFSPQYGELYYEIYLGNHSHLAHAAWWGSYFCLDQDITADIHLGRSTSLHLGYRSGILSTKANNLVTRIITHTASIGVSGEWISFSPSGHPASIVKSISATY